MSILGGLHGQREERRRAAEACESAGPCEALSQSPGQAQLEPQTPRLFKEQSSVYNKLFSGSLTFPLVLLTEIVLF